MKLNYELCELCGILIGDGCLSRFYVKSEKRFRTNLYISGGLDDRTYFEKRIIPIFKNNFNFEPKITKYPNCNAIRIITGNKKVREFFENINFPIGKKGEIKISKKITKLGKKHLYRVIRGIFDTDGCFYSRKDENYKYPHILITSYSNSLRIQLRNFLRKEGFPAYIHGEDVIFRGKENTLKWFNLIGSSHPIILKRYNNWKHTGVLLPKYMGW
jgi:hypothetical protein